MKFVIRKMIYLLFAMKIANSKSIKEDCTTRRILAFEKNTKCEGTFIDNTKEPALDFL